MPIQAHADQAALDQAEKLYQSGDWEKARQAYKAELATAADPNRLPPAFFFNYGTVLAKALATGEAYVPLLRAAFHQPFDADIKANLRQVEQQLPATVRAVQPAAWFRWWPHDLRFFPWQFWLLLALISSALAFLLAKRADRTFTISCGLVAALLFVGAGLAWVQMRVPVYGVMALAKVKSGPGTTFTDITTLEPGSLVNQEASRDGWLKIRFLKEEADVETVGWVEPGTVLEVR